MFPEGSYLLVPMRPVRALFLYLMLVFVLGALLAPWLFWAAQTLAQYFPGLKHLADNPFHRFVNRSLLLLALFGLWPFLRGLGIRSWASVGLGRSKIAWGELGQGFGWGFLSLALVALIAFACGARRLNPALTFASVLTGASEALLSAIVVGLLEELLFRGAILGALRRAHAWGLALLLSSAIYSIVHFFQRPPSPSEIHWLSGFIILGHMLRGFIEWPLLFPGFITLAVAGSILGLAFLQAGTLYRSIGLHAGWVFWLKFYGLLTVPQPLAQQHRWFWGTGKLFDATLALLILLPVLVLFWRKYARSHDAVLVQRS